MRATEFLTEKWSQKYKRSINCSHPKGFSQRAHCAGKKKHNESVEQEMTCPDCGMCATHGNMTLSEIKQRLDPKCWKNKHIGKPATKIKNGVRVNNCVPNESLNEFAPGSGQDDEPHFNPETYYDIPKLKKVYKQLASRSVNSGWYDLQLRSIIDAMEELYLINADVLDEMFPTAPEIANYIERNIIKAFPSETPPYIIKNPDYSPRAPRAPKPGVAEGEVVSMKDDPSTIKRLARQWWTGNPQEYAHAQQMLNRMGWDIYEDEDDIIVEKDGQEYALSMDELEAITESEAWQKANKRDKTDGMSRKAVKTYRREHPGSKLQTAVTTKPSKLKKGSKASKRRKSYCSRSRGQMKMHNISCAKTPDKAICKARRRWNCE